MEQKDAQEDSLREQSGAVVHGVRAAVLHATQHFEALVELLQLELLEYGRAQVQRAALALAGVVLLVVAYLFLWMGLVMYCLAEWGSVGFICAVGAAVAFNLVAGGVALLAAVRRKPVGVAPATCRELKDDLQCIKLYLRGKDKS